MPPHARPPQTQPPHTQPLAADLSLARRLADIALAAGRVILEVQGRGFAVASKADASPVTEADRRAEAVILAALASAFPGIPVLAEEAAAGGARFKPQERFFLVDPLDGTREFIAGNGEFTVNIALIDKGRPVAGVVLAPACGDLFAAARDCGARRLAAPGSTADTAALARAPRLATRRPAPGALKAVASRSHRDPQTDAFLAKLGVRDVTSAGSSLKFCLIAAGLADVYPRFGRTMEWDTAAGQAVLECAGGAVLDEAGAPLRYGKQEADYENPYFIAWGRFESGHLPNTLNRKPR